MSNECPFCRPPEVLLENELANELAFVLPDRFPVTAGHLLILPRRHVADWFDTTPEERLAMLELVDAAKAWLAREYQPDGYNMGINVGEAAGQTIFHVHIHLIPRYKGDVAQPRGGVRGVIPGKQSY